MGTGQECLLLTISIQNESQFLFSIIKVVGEKGREERDKEEKNLKKRKKREVSRYKDWEAKNNYFMIL